MFSISKRPCRRKGGYSVWRTAQRIALELGRLGSFVTKGILRRPPGAASSKRATLGAEAAPAPGPLGDLACHPRVLGDRAQRPSAEDVAQERGWASTDMVCNVYTTVATLQAGV